MAGIYIHIPFCRRACHYCNFHFSTSPALNKEMIQSLKQEILLSKNDPYILGQTIQTIYFGGGTPSLLDKRNIEELLSGVKNNFEVDPAAEITLEANPDDINAISLEGWKNIGINRLSVGLQSFIDRDLKWMNRVHNSQQALLAIKMIKESGINNYSVDLIYGTPSLTIEEWKKNVETIIALDVPHVAAYALTVEPGTALQSMIKLGKKADISSDDQAEQFLQLMEWMKKAGYEHYEISNFARPGFRSKHNSSYWKGTPYLGIGPSAHSFSGKARKWNIANNPRYIKSIKKNAIPFEEEVLTKGQQLNEYIMTSLRTIDGLDLRFVEKNFSPDDRLNIESDSAVYKNKKMMLLENEHLMLTQEGKLFADGIASALFRSQSE
ncbi:MAG: radical SAM family heme chaperone HemW [Ginsengibacter sp.]